MNDTPNGWRRGRLEDFVFLQRGFDITEMQAKAGNVPVISSSGYSYSHNEAKANPPGVVIGRKGKLGGIYRVDVPFWPHDTTLWVKDFKGNAPDFVAVFLEFMQLERLDAATSVPTLNRNNVHVLPVVFPPLPEQRKIAEILGTWDAAIERVARLIAALQRRKQGLMQRLLTGKVRFPEFAGEAWATEKAGNIFQPFSKRNNGEEELLSVTQDQGVVPRSMLETRVVMPAGSTEGYKLVESGDFIISLRSFQGGIEYSNYRGLVSPAYTVLKPTIAIVDSFYKHLFKSQEFIARLGVAIIGIRDGKQINFADFAALRLVKPSLKEQLKIAQVLDICDDEIRLHQQYLAALRQQKQGLMQRLLTGQVRVPVATTANAPASAANQAG
jgi:restriction endonuclease S subunit